MKKSILVIQIIVSTLCVGDLEKLTEYLPAGVVLTGDYDAGHTQTYTSLSTIATGTQPSTHGIVAPRWWNWVENSEVTLLGGDEPSPENLIVPTLGDALLEQSPNSHVVTIATRPESAIAMNGKRGMPFWMATSNDNFVSSTPYMLFTPEWVKRLNVERVYPKGDILTLELAKSAIAHLSLGGRGQVDLLNICLEESEAVVGKYGHDSFEATQMYRRLGRALADFMTYAHAQHPKEEVVIILTGAHGTSPATATQLFNGKQFKVITNGFLSARYGPGDWVIGYETGSLWLNHNLIYSKKLSLTAVQDEVAAFALQFDGVAHALSATALKNSGFSTGYGRRMQNSFYPKRAGDVVINLMPGWIESCDNVRSAPGSLYGYDTRVPIVLYSQKHKTPGSHDEKHPVAMTSIAPTLARIMGINPPYACDEQPLEL